ncbi:MAG: hypothetical protein ACR2NV_09400 [Thermoleophilaceae bacterium]|jgi:hypothetical protein
MIRGVLRYLIGRRLARFLPGGWLVFLLTSPRVRRWVSATVRRRLARRRSL